MKIKIVLYILIFTGCHFFVNGQTYDEIKQILVNVDRYKYKKVDESIEQNSLLKLIEIYPKIKDSLQLANANEALGAYYSSIYEHEKSIDHYKKGISGYKNLKQWGLFAHSIKQLVQSFRNNKTPELIEPLLLESNRITLNQDIGFYAMFLRQELLIYYSYDVGEYEKGVPYGVNFLEMLAHYEKQNIKSPRYEYLKTVDAAIVQLELGHCYLEIDSLSQAYTHLEISRAFFEPKKDYEKLARIYKHKLKWAIKTGHPPVVTVKLLELYNNYTEESKRVILDQIEKDLQESNALIMQEEESKKVLRDKIIISLIVFLLIVIVFTLVVSKQKVNLRVKEIERLKVKGELGKSEAFIEGEQNERKKIADELHDNVNGDLAVLKYNLTAIDKSTISNDAIGKIDKAISILDKSIDEIRSMSHDISSPTILNFNLIESIHVYAERVSNSAKINIDFQSFGDDFKIDTKRGDLLYKSVKELLNNIEQHAQANNVLLQFLYKDKKLNITIEDDGIGYDINSESTGIGLKNISYRLDLIGAKLNVVSDDYGTTTEIEVFL